jgi:putative membrane protein
MVHMSLLGALIALSPHLLYRAQTAGAPEFGFTPLEDQQLGGLIMWVPAGTIYASIALAMLVLWIAPSAQRRSSVPAQ